MSDKMKEYIEREIALKWQVPHYSANGVEIIEGKAIPVEYIENLPAADVVEVRTGRWILNTVRDEWQQFHSDPECSECGFHPYYYHGHSVMKYCPNCGAKMDGGVNDAAD